MRNIWYYLPPLNKLLRSLRNRSREFLRENTLHGFPYFVDPRRPRWERIIWFVATMTSIGLGIGIIITIYQTFQSEPTLTGLDTQTEQLVVYFPSLTLCNVIPTLKFGRYEADSAHYSMMYNWSWQPVKGMEPNMDLADETYSQFFFRVSPECGDLYENCTYNAKKVPCGELFEKKIVSRGVCCSVEASEITRESRPRQITFDTTAYPISLDLLEKNESPPGRQTSYAYLLKTGTTMRVAIQFTYSTPDVVSLLKSQRKCQNLEKELSYSMCIHNCHKKVILDKCGCLPWFMMIGDESMECTRAQYNCIAGNSTFIDRRDCKCYLPCNHTTYNVDMIQTFGNNHVELSIPSWPSAIFKREIRFGWLDLLVSFGGIAGLCVGYSLLTTVELTYYLSLRAYCGAVLAESDQTLEIKLKKLKKARRRRVINVVDLRKDYYNYVE